MNPTLVRCLACDKFWTEFREIILEFVDKKGAALSEFGNGIKDTLKAKLEGFNVPSKIVELLTGLLDHNRPGVVREIFFHQCCNNMLGATLLPEMQML